MSEHEVRVEWKLGGVGFTPDTYDRTHRWTFGGGVGIEASAAPEYRGRRELPNPEEALVAALSSCHMLTFLALAAGRRLVVERYEDHAVGRLEKNAQGRLAITRATLRPRVVFGGEKRPTADELSRLHHLAHERCFIANSVTTEVSVEPRAGDAP
jgi:organic hydroperoxide reductase OsmC/OhrA